MNANRPVVVILRGTSGSGKTYIARSIMDALGPPDGTSPLGPKGKTGTYSWRKALVSLVGRYETACGGCDSLSWRGAADDIERRVVSQVFNGYSVLLEGLMVSGWGAERILRLDALAPGGARVLHLTTDLETCLSAVRSRRVERAAALGREPDELNTKNTTTKRAGLIVASRNQAAKGVRVEYHDRSSALDRCRGLLGVRA